MANLPESVKTRILSFPEYRMGAHKVALVFRDGRVVEDVIVAWGGEIVSVGGTTDFDIDPEDVIDAENRV